MIRTAIESELKADDKHFEHLRLSLSRHEYANVYYRARITGPKIA